MARTKDRAPRDRALRRTRLRVLAFITVAATATISFSSVQHLAASAGFGWLSWLFPLVVDAVAAFGMDVWMRHSAAQRSAGSLALSAIGLSLAANVADHYLATGLVLAAVLGAIPPMMLAWLLLVLHRHGATETSTTAVDPVPNPVPVDPVPARPYQGPVPQFTPFSVNREDVSVWGPVDPVPEYQSPLLPHLEDRSGTEDRVDPVPTVTESQPAPRDFPGTAAHMTEAVPLTPARHTTPPERYPESPAEQTMVMPRIKADQPEERAKVVTPAERPRRLVSVSTLGAKSDNAELAADAARQGLTSRRAVMAAYSVGSGRATKIISMMRGGSDGAQASAR